MAGNQTVAASNGILYLLNIIYSLSGIGLCVLGVWTGYFWYSFSVFANYYIDVATRAVTLIGVSVFLLTFVSSMAASKASLSVVRVCCVMLGWSLICQIEARIVAGLYKEKSEASLKNSMHDSIQTYFGSDASRLVWDRLQSRKECCGVDGYFDWASRFGIDHLPDSCCAENVQSRCQSTLSQNDTLFKAGCYDELMADINYGFLVYEIANTVGIVFGIETALYGLLYVRINEKADDEETSVDRESGSSEE